MAAKVSSAEATFSQHIIELRTTLLRAFSIALLGVAIALFFYQQILEVLLLPLNKQTEELATHTLAVKNIENTTDKEVLYFFSNNASLLSADFPIFSEKTSEITIPPKKSITIAEKRKNANLVLLSPLEGITTTLKVCFWTGIVTSSPFWLYIFFQFIEPAFEDKRKRLALPFLGTSLLFLLAGVMFAYFVTIPLANQYLLAFSSSLGENMWSLQHYIDYTLILALANALAFELCLLLFFLVQVGILTEDFMRSKRRHFIVAAFILAAILTPPDVLTQALVAIPMIGFYELTILYAKQKALLNRKNSSFYSTQALQ